MSNTSIPPVGPDAAAPPWSRLAVQSWLEFRRILRGWRWRGLFVVLGAAAVVMSRGEMFGYSAAVFFPGGKLGATVAPFVLALGALVLGSESWGGLDRARASRLAASRLSHPFEFVVARLAAVGASSLLIAAFVAVWPLLGAWRGGLDVLAMPSLMYLGGVVAPLVLCGAASGLFGRIAAGGDTSGVALGALALAPALWFRMSVSEPLDVFLRVSLQLGVLVPGEVLLRDAGITAMCALPFAGLAALLLPPQRGRTPLASGTLEKLAALATVARISHWLVARLRHAGPVTAALSLLVAASGAPAFVLAARSRPFPEQRIDWGLSAEPPGADRGRLPAVRIFRREIRIPDSPAGGIEVKLTVAPAGAAAQSTAAFTFGPALRVLSVAGGDGPARVVSALEPADSHITVVAADKPFSPKGTELAFNLEVDPRARRRWERAYAPGFRSFAGIADWWGEPVEVDFANTATRVVSQPAAFRIEVPPVESMEWACGPARSEAQAGGGAVLLSSSPAVPSALLAARLNETRHPHDAFNLSWLAFPERDKLMKSFPEVYRDSLGRIERLFGPQSAALRFYEVPLQESADPMAMPSPLLDRLEFALPRFRDWDSPSEAEFDEAFRPWNRGLVSEIINRSWDAFGDDALMREAMIGYIDEYALLRGETRELTRETRLDATLAPWKFARYRIPRPPAPPRPQQQGFGGPGGPGGPGNNRPFLIFSEEYFPFDIREADARAFEGPIGPNRTANSTPVTDRRRRAFIHMLRTLMGDEPFCAMIREVYGTRHDGELTMAHLREVSERHASRDLGWFFRDWAEVGVVPKLRILEVSSLLAENPRTRVIEYRTTAKVANLGTGNVEVQWLLQTEGDPVEGATMLGPEAEENLTIVTLSRPTDFAIDPWGSVVSVAEFDANSRQPIHPRVFIKTIAEM